MLWLSNDIKRAPGNTHQFLEVAVRKKRGNDNGRWLGVGLTCFGKTSASEMPEMRLMKERRGSGTAVITEIDVTGGQSVQIDVKMEMLIKSHSADMPPNSPCLFSLDRILDNIIPSNCNESKNDITGQQSTVCVGRPHATLYELGSVA